LHFFKTHSVESVPTHFKCFLPEETGKSLLRKLKDRRRGAGNNSA